MYYEYLILCIITRIIPVAVAVGEHKFIDTPLGQSVGQPAFVRGVRDLNTTEILQSRMWHDDLFHRLAQR